MRMHSHLPTAAIPLAVLLFSCGGDPLPDNAHAPLVIGDEAPTVATSLYQMPTPNELFLLVREMAGEGQKRMMNPAVNAERYVSLPKRAVNFGVFSTDLIYASYFGLNVEVVRYYLKVKQLGDQLGLTAAFTEGDFARLESSVMRGRTDSIQILGDEAYYKAYQRLQDENMGSTLALVLAGGWVESMHLVIKQVEEFNTDDPLVKRVAEQKVTLEHLIDMIGPYAADSTVAPILRNLSEVRSIYDTFPVTRTPNKGKSSSGRMVLGDDVNMEISAENFGRLSAAVEALREEMVLPEEQAKVQINP
jgi:hypothetical protein